MRTVTTSKGDVKADQSRQEHFAQAHSGATSSERKSHGALIERDGHEEWKQRLDENWQSHLETLQKYVCELLIKNQKLRTALLSTSEPRRGYRDTVHL